MVRERGPVAYARIPDDGDLPVEYELGPDSRTRDDAPAGRIESFEWSASRIYPGTTRTVWLYVPQQYSPNVPVPVMVFQDGWLYLDPDLEMRAGIVFDNLIHAGSIPPMIGIFVDPGQPGNRNLEYDPDDDRYASFLIDEILPQVRERFSILDNPDWWGICGGSSGGNCAFTAAWQRPDRFRRVLTFVASFAQIPGGNQYPAFIRREPVKPLRIFMQEGSRDLNWDRADQNWVSNNLLVAAALAERGYDYRLILGDGGHSPNHGASVLPDALRWLWRV